MTLLLQTIVLICAVTVRTALGYNTGIGLDPACENLTPQHGAQAQTSTSPYTISFTPASYTPGQPVSVTISGAPFRGFMIQARRAAGSSTTMLGSFTVVDNTRQACSGSQALVHSSGNDKTSLTFNWIPPADAADSVVFRATFVQTEVTFWTNVASWQLNPAGSSGNPPSLNPATQTPVTATTTTAQSLGTVAADPECDGTTKGCFTSCTGNTCKFIVSWKEDGTDVVYNFTAAVEFSDGSYVALGFSSDSKMGGDSVMGCAFGTNGTVVSFTAENVGKISSTFADGNVQLVSKSYNNGVLKCSLRRPINIGGSDKLFNVSQPWTLLFARGRAFVATGVSLTNHLSENYVSEAAVTSKFRGNVNVQGEGNPMYKAHGCLMVAAWLIFSSIGIITARFYKPVWKNTILSLKVWFQIHRLCMVLVFCLTAIGFIIIFVEEKEWSKVENEAEYLSGHPIIGVIVMILTVLNPVMSLFRCDPGTPKRPLFNWAHFIVGVSAHILAVIAIFFGVRLRGAVTPYYTVYILGAYVAWILFVEILLELITLCDKRIITQDTYEMGSSDNPKVNPPGSESKKTILIKRVILVLHCVVVASLAAAVMAIIGVGEGSDS
ncbi:putative ferric-chelate reductase 1 [Physella acuta]|uniref:putative ferric-chelate reductase 1 n=1 Tax=Physella acuta TaxID=109671 RepID=UPI0027DDD9D1|nr:putative ferric-chelate reductase 1 [Physella acuta]